jgi:hypothetical protein
MNNQNRANIYVRCPLFGGPKGGRCRQVLLSLLLQDACKYNIFQNLSIYFDFVFSVTACIRRQEGYCCVQYQVCPDVISPFSLDTAITTAVIKAQVDTQCTNDYVTIPGSRLG